MCHYNTADAPLPAGDWGLGEQDGQDNAKEDQICTTTNHSAGGEDELEESQREGLRHSSGTFKGVVLRFQLPSSCYATMALRQVFAYAEKLNACGCRGVLF